MATAGALAPLHASALRGAARADRLLLSPLLSSDPEPRSGCDYLWPRGRMRVVTAGKGALAQMQRGSDFSRPGGARVPWRPERSPRARHRRVAGLVQLALELGTRLEGGRAHILAGLAVARAQREERGRRDARRLEGADHDADAGGQARRERVGVERRDVVAGEPELGELVRKGGEERAGADVALAGSQNREGVSGEGAGGVAAASAPGRSTNLGGRERPAEAGASLGDALEAHALEVAGGDGARLRAGARGERERGQRKNGGELHCGGSGRGGRVVGDSRRRNEVAEERFIDLGGATRLRMRGMPSRHMARACPRRPFGQRLPRARGG